MVQSFHEIVQFNEFLIGKITIKVMACGSLTDHGRIRSGPKKRANRCCFYIVCVCVCFVIPCVRDITGAGVQDDDEGVSSPAIIPFLVSGWLFWSSKVIGAFIWWPPLVSKMMGLTPCLKKKKRNSPLLSYPFNIIKFCITIYIKINYS